MSVRSCKQQFFSIQVFLHVSSRITGLQWKEEVISLTPSFLLLPPASPTFRHQPGDYCIGITSAHWQGRNSSGKYLAAQSKLLTYKLQVLSNTFLTFLIPWFIIQILDLFSYEMFIVGFSLSTLETLKPFKEPQEIS